MNWKRRDLAYLLKQLKEFMVEYDLMDKVVFPDEAYIIDVDDCINFLENLVIQPLNVDTWTKEEKAKETEQ